MKGFPSMALALVSTEKMKEAHPVLLVLLYLISAQGSEDSSAP
jgi:hypothetical protein